MCYFLIFYLVVVFTNFFFFFFSSRRRHTRYWRDWSSDVCSSDLNSLLTAKDRVIYHGNEWMTGLGVLYIQKNVPQIATVFTTHATSIGRSIAGNNKPLYEYLFAYNGDQMAGELNMESKHSIEKQTALHVDCFTTVSDITDNECKELLDKPADVVLPNGFEDDFRSE